MGDNDELSLLFLSKTQKAFTLIEVVIVLALIAFVSLLTIGNFSFLRDGFTRRPVDEVLKKAVHAARYQAVKVNRPVFMRFDSKTQVFEIRDESGELIGDVFDSDVETLRVEFFPVKPEDSVDNRPRYELALRPVDRVPFYPDRSCMPFLAAMQSDESGTIRLRFDPFSNIGFVNN